MTAVREQVLAALEKRLRTLQAGDPTLKVHRNRRAQLDEPNSLALEDGPQSTQADDSTGFKIHLAQPTIEGYVTAPTDAEIGPAINELYGKIVAAIELDGTLADLAGGEQPGDGPAIDCLEAGLKVQIVKNADAKQAEAFFDLEYSVEYTTAQGDPAKRNA